MNVNRNTEFNYKDFHSIQKTAKRTIGIVLAINILFGLTILVGAILAIKKYLL